MTRCALPGLITAGLLTTAALTSANPALRFDHDLHGEDAGIDCQVCHPDPQTPGMPPAKTCRACHISTQLTDDCALCHIGQAPRRPAFHLPGWDRVHALHVRTTPIGACAHCHREQDCRTCHAATGRDSIALDPQPQFISYRKVLSPHIGPTASRVHPPGYQQEHAVAARRENARCSACHAPRDEDPLCSGCHGFREELEPSE